MADLGNLFFSLGLDTRNIDAAWKKAFEKYSKEAKINLLFDSKAFKEQMEAQKILHKKNMDALSIEKKAKMDAIALREREALMAERVHTQEARTQSVRDRSASAIKNTNSALTTQNRLMQNIHTLAASYISIFAAGRLVRSLVEVSGEFEMQRVSLQAILKDLDGANRIFDQIKKLSVQSPFQFKDLISYTKQLSAFSIPMNELYDTTKMLSDVSAGLGVGMNRLVLAYGQIRAASVLRGQEVRQLTEAGIPVIEELREKFEELGETGITASDVFDKISARLVPFSMIKEMFTDLTSEGGKFYKMQEIQAETLKGKVSNLKDAYQIMFAEIGEKGDGVLKRAVDATRWLITNYEEVGKTILELVAVYGTYKAAVIALNTINKIHVAMMMAQATSTTTLTTAQTIGIASTNAFAAAQTKLNNAIMKNPYVLAAAAVAALGYTIYKVITYQDDYNKSLSKLENFSRDAQKSIIAETSELDRLYAKLELAKKGSAEYLYAKDAIQKKYGGILKNLEEEKGLVIDVADAYDVLKKSIIGAANERGYQKAIAGAADDYAEQLMKVSDVLNKNLDVLVSKGKISSKFSARVTEAMTSVFRGDVAFNEIDKEVQDFVKKTDKSLFGALFEMKFGTPKGDYDLNALISWSQRIREEFNKIESEAANLFGDRSREGDFVGPVLDPSKIVASSKKWVQDINEFLKKSDLLDKGYEKRTEESPEDYIDRLRGEYKSVTELISSRSKLAGEDVSGLRDKLASLKGIFKAANISPLTDEELSRQSKKNEKEADKEEKAADKLKDLVTKLELELSKAKVDSMEEGWRKEIAEMDYQHQKRLEKIEEYRKDLLDLQEKSGGSGTTLTADNATTIAGLTTEENNAYKAKQKANYEKLLDNYADFERKKQNIDKWFTEEKLKLRKQETIEGYEENQRALKVLTDNYHKQMRELMDDELNLMMKSSPLLVRIFSDTANLSRKTIKGMMADAKQLLKYISGDKSVGLPAGIKPEDADKMIGKYKSISQLQETIMKMEEEMAAKRTYPFASFVNSFDFIKRAHDEINSIREDMSDEEKRNREVAAEAFKTQAAKSFGSAVAEAGDAVLYVADSMGKLADATNNAKLKETAEQFKSIGSLMSAAGKGAQEGGWVGAIVGAVTSIITQTVDAVAVAKAEQYEFEQNEIDFLNTYKNLLLTLKEEDYETIFGVRYLSMASDAAKNAAKAIREYNTLLAKRTAPELERESWSKGFAAFTSTQGLSNLIQVATAESKTALNAYKKGYTDIQRMAIKTKDQSGWANFLGKKDQYKTLFDLAPEIWGGDIGGDFNIDAANAFLETNTQITDEQRKQIENLIKQRELYDENINIIREDIQDTFGDLGDAMTDAIVQSVTTGADAFSIFEAAGITAIENLGKKLIYELFFANKFKKLQDALEATYTDEANQTPEDVANAQRKLLQDFFSTIGNDMKNAREWAEKWKQESQAAGFNVWQNDSDNTLASGIEGIQEKTANLLGSYINAIRADVAANRLDVKNMLPIIGNINDLMGNSLAELQMINSNTLRSAKGTEAIIDKLNSLTTTNGAAKLNVRAYTN